MSRGEPLIRQWKLLKAMQSFRYGLDAEELAARVECCKRQVLRDLKVLQDVGFPVSFEERDFGKRFWKLSANFIESDKLILSVTELVSLYLGQKLLAPLSGTQFGEGLDMLLKKIKSSIPPSALSHFSSLEDTFLVKSRTFNDYSLHDKKIRLLHQAIQERWAVKICYQSLSKKSPYDTVYHPYGMVFFDGDLYCIGFMDEYGEVRTLKLNRIQSAELTGTHFGRPREFSLKDYTQNAFGIFTPAGKPQTVHVQMHQWAAAIVREKRYHPSQKILNDQKDSLTVQFELDDTTELKRWILGFGSRAIVLHPLVLAKQVHEEVKLMAGHYAGKTKKSKK